MTGFIVTGFRCGHVLSGWHSEIPKGCHSKRGLTQKGGK